MPLTELKLPGYELKCQIGSGGMATVYLATQNETGNEVAIKVMRATSGENTNQLRFIKEGRTLARLPHPNIVAIHQVAQDETLNYIVMECLDGGTLSDRLARGVCVAEAIRVIVQIADAIGFAHEHGVIHRDLKPDNIMFRGDGKPVLTDFGIARTDDHEGSPLTQAGTAVGTPAYMSPEQAQGGRVDGRSDLYALGILFYQMLTGRLPFYSDNPMEIARAHVLTPPPPLPADRAFAQPLMDRLLAKRPEGRYADVRSFIRDLRHLVIDNAVLRELLQFHSDQPAAEQLATLGFSDAQLLGHASRPPSPAAAADAPPGMVAKQLLSQSKLEMQSTDPQPKRPARPAPAPPPEPRSIPIQTDRPKWLLPAIAVLAAAATAAVLVMTL